MVTTKNDLNTVYIGNIKQISIPISEIDNTKGSRFDASVYCTDGRTARLKLESSKLQLSSLAPHDGLVSDCLYPSRFKRIYVEKKYGLDFFLPSQISEIYPKPDKYISPKTEVDIDNLKVQKNSLLLTRSGTVGKLTYVSDTLSGKIFSDDVIRIYFSDPTNAGYVYAFLKSETGQDILTTNNYGAVVQHVEPSHLSEIKIPSPHNKLKERIHSLITNSYKLRDKASRLVDEAQQKLIQELKLPPLYEIQQKVFDKCQELTAYTVSASNLHNRFDGSYHVPIIDAINNYISKHSDRVVMLGDKAISSEIFLPGRFKRVYVEKGQGTKFIGSKQIGELNPDNTKYLSLSKHKNELTELKLKENIILISRSGTIGNIKIVPKHWESWVINEHVIRLVASSKDIAGYIYAWLDTPYGKELIKRFTFGSVVDEIDTNNVSSVQIPLLKSKLVQKNINNLILKSNKLLTDAYLLEEEAIKEIDTKVFNLN